jgi:hypothetical protein
MPTEQLTVQQTATHYWVVQREGVDVAGAVTREGADAECELLRGLRARRVRRAPRRNTRRRGAPLHRAS